MKIASYNINGIRARLPRLLDWLAESETDIVLLQEIKCVDSAFPRAEFETLGYQVETHGQKQQNGVAILSKMPMEEVVHGLPGDDEDLQARWIEATVIGRIPVRVCCLYLPNGNPVDGPKYPYKLEWMARMEARAAELLQLEEATLFAGDFNVIPQAEDAMCPENWEDDALFRYETREAWRRLVHLGLTDAFRSVTPEGTNFTFWDFQRGAWQRNDGIRIDHFLLTPQCADLLVDCRIDSHVRGWEKPSDHVPIWAELDA